MNIQNLMAQAKKIQGEMEKLNKEIEATIFTEENEAVFVEMNGKSEITKINIKSSEMVNDKEILEDMILLAVNKALNKIKETKESKLGKYTGGMGGLF
jgi:DNA-binding YbaB/EbfC family protein